MTLVAAVHAGTWSVRSNFPKHLIKATFTSNTLFVPRIAPSTTLPRSQSIAAYSSISQSSFDPTKLLSHNHYHPRLRTFTSTTTTMSSATTFYKFTPKDKKGTDYPLSQHTGKVILAVNTASKCGFTPQFQGLESLWKKIQSGPYKDDFVILAFPCNQFNSQDPGDNDTIQSFCQVNYGVTFPVLGKTEVNGNEAEPVWEWMKGEKPGLMGLKRVKWNFEKFLIGRDGKVVNRWASTSKPEGLEGEIMKELEKSKPASL